MPISAPCHFISLTEILLFIVKARSPYINHTLQRTFAPAVNALIGCDIPRPAEDIVDFPSDKLSDADEMMLIPEMEIANLDSRFKVNVQFRYQPHQNYQFILNRENKNLQCHGFCFQVDLDQLYLAGSLDLQLVCKLEDVNLPSVPPLHITVPQDYPQTAPLCSSQQDLYGNLESMNE